METFLVLPLRPWKEDDMLRSLRSFYFSIPNFLKETDKPTIEFQAASRFYIVYLDFLSRESSIIKMDTKGLERVSIIDPSDLMTVAMDNEPVKKLAQVIFEQLKISERSPYIFAGAVHDLFVGREVEMALIRGLPENIGIFGTRTIGKTSLLLKLYREIKDHQRWNVIALDCSSMEGKKKLLKEFAKKLNVPYSKISTLGKFKDFITSQAVSQKKQYLFLMDEVDELVDYDTRNRERIFKTFNQLCTEPLEKGVAARFVLFGFHKIYKHMNDPASRLYNFMVFLPLKPLAWDSAYNLVTRPMKAIHIRWEDEKNDAAYLLEQCSCHPLLLQAACHSLLEVLDKKEENSGTIEKADIDSVFIMEQFQQLAMRLYNSHLVDSEKDKKKQDNKDLFLKEIHKITILIAILLYVEEGISGFTLQEMRTKLYNYGIDVSPDDMREIFNRLCLNGTFRLLEDVTIISKKSRDQIYHSLRKYSVEDSQPKYDTIKNVTLHPPEYYARPEKNIGVFKYEFGVKIFPYLLIENLGGIESCHQELANLLKKDSLKKWLKRSL